MMRNVIHLCVIAYISKYDVRFFVDRNEFLFELKYLANKSKKIDAEDLTRLIVGVFCLIFRFFSHLVTSLISQLLFDVDFLCI